MTNTLIHICMLHFVFAISSHSGTRVHLVSTKAACPHTLGRLCTNAHFLSALSDAHFFPVLSIQAFLCRGTYFLHNQSELGCGGAGAYREPAAIQSVRWQALSNVVRKVRVVFIHALIRVASDIELSGYPADWLIYNFSSKNLNFNSLLII